MPVKKARQSKKARKSGKAGPVRPVRHVRISFTKRGRPLCSPPSIGANRGDTIAWTISRNYPFAIFIKSAITPLSQHFFHSSFKPKAKKVILAAVSPMTPSGCYPYAMVTYDGKKILYLDPDIIVPKPGGR